MEEPGVLRPQRSYAYDTLVLGDFGSGDPAAGDGKPGAWRGGIGAASGVRSWIAAVSSAPDTPSMAA